MNKKLFLAIILISIGFSQQKLKFSADIAESYKEDNTILKVFKNNVKIIDQNKILYTDLAKYYQDVGCR